MQRRLTLLTEISGFTSYGLHAQEIVSGLERLANIWVSVRATKVVEAYGVRAPQNMLQRQVYGPQPEPIEMILAPPTVVPTPGKRTIYFTMWESTRLPKQSVELLNKAELVIVPSQWNAECFSACGVDTPIKVVPLGYDEQVFKKTVLPEYPPIVFGAGGWTGNGRDRKGLHHIIRYFQEAFPERDDVRLKIKCMPDCQLECDDKRVECTRKFLNKQQLAEWYSSLHCFVNLAPGGFELMLLEAMACGRYGIGIMQNGIGKLADDVVKTSLEPASDRWKGHGHWAKPVPASVIEALRRAEVGMGSDHGIENLTWTKHHWNLIEILSAMMESKPLELESQPPIYVQLGRYGDLINLLPVLREVSKEQIPTVLVSRKYADVLAGVSYVNPMLCDEDVLDLNEAIQFARKMNQNVLVPQVTGRNYQFEKKTEHYNTEQWDRIGWLDRWSDLELIFDQRNYEREAVLAETTLDLNKPNVLICTESHSSPFPRAIEFTQKIKEGCDAKGFNLVDISSLKAHRIYDVLGLMDRSVLLITVDTAILHLAAASTIPVVALVTDKPSMWHGTEPRCNKVSIIPYEHVDERYQPDDFLPAVRTHEPAIHIYSFFEGSGEMLRRQRQARNTWQFIYRWYRWVKSPVFNSQLSRLFQDYGRSLPYARDVIDHGVWRYNRPDNIIVLTNTDICFVSALDKMMRERLRSVDAVYTHRIDFEGQFRGLKELKDLEGRQPYPGNDLFAFRVSWWNEYGRAHMPDLLLGAEAWDWCLRVVIQQSHSGRDCELPPCTYHERHESLWASNRFTLPSQKYNMAIAKKFLSERGQYHGEFER